MVKYSVTHSVRKRSEIYFEGNIARKIIYEELTEQDEGGLYQEADMDVATNNRQFVLPKTSRGREQKLTPSLLLTPTYEQAQLYVVIAPESGMVSSYNCSNDQQLPLPCMEPASVEEFYTLSEKYIASCPDDYDKIIDTFHNKKHVTVKFTAGDIFRQQITPTLYTYALILCKVRQLEKWQELPANHPLRCVMTQPIMYRQYGIVTENPNMTVEELSKVPLLDVRIAQDNEILWGIYPIVGSKQLEESDIDLGFTVNNRLKTAVWGLAVHTFDEDECGIFVDDSQRQSGLCFNGLTKTVSMTYSVAVSINLLDNDGNAGEIVRKETQNDLLKKRIAEYYGFQTETACDEFAEKFGGITRKQFIELAGKRFRR